MIQEMVSTRKMASTFVSDVCSEWATPNDILIRITSTSQNGDGFNICCVRYREQSHSRHHREKQGNLSLSHNEHRQRGSRHTVRTRLWRTSFSDKSPTSCRTEKPFRYIILCTTRVPLRTTTHPAIGLSLRHYPHEIKPTIRAKRQNTASSRQSHAKRQTKNEHRNPMETAKEFIETVLIKRQHVVSIYQIIPHLVSFRVPRTSK